VEAWMPYLVIVAGLFSAAGGIFGWQWFLNSRKARLWVRMLGPGGARVFYVLLGLAITGLGVGMATGLVPTKRGDPGNESGAEVR